MGEPCPTPGMVDALHVFDIWLQQHETQPTRSIQQQHALQQEWKRYQQLCYSAANAASSRSSFTNEEEFLRRARQNRQCGQACLIEAFSVFAQQKRRKRTNPNTMTPTAIAMCDTNEMHKNTTTTTDKMIGMTVPFPLAAFVSVFGGPGIHGYGTHDITTKRQDDNFADEDADDEAEVSPRSMLLSRIVITSLDGVLQLVAPKYTVNTIVMTIFDGRTPQRLHLLYNRSQQRIEQMAIEYVVDDPHQHKISSLWNNLRDLKKKKTKQRCSLAIKNSKEDLKQAAARDLTNDEDNDQHNNTRTTSTATSNSPLSWTCTSCTFEHTCERTQIYLACAVCSTERAVASSASSASVAASSSSTRIHPQELVDVVANESQHKNYGYRTSLPLSPTVATTTNNTAPKTPRSWSPSSQGTSVAWGSLRPPSEQDLRGPSSARKRRRQSTALSVPRPMVDYLVVMDLEWTADKDRTMQPICEITQLPSVVLKVVERKHTNNGYTTTATTTDTATSTTTDTVTKQDDEDRRKDIEEEKDVSVQTTYNSPVPLPDDLLAVSKKINENDDKNDLMAAVKRTRPDAYAVAAFDTFVRPTCNPKLTPFAIALTAISQKDVDAAPTIATALARYMAWLQALDLVDATGGRNGHWYFVTWGDSDIMTTLRHELAYNSIPLPSCFDRWINLKSDAMYQKHYGHPPTGGLRACFDRIRPSLSWKGRAHNGLVDILSIQPRSSGIWSKPAFGLHDRRAVLIQMGFPSDKRRRKLDAKRIT